MLGWKVGLGGGGEEVGPSCFLLYTFLQWFGVVQLAYTVFQIKYIELFFQSWHQFYGKLSEGFQRVPWISFAPCHRELSSLNGVRGRVVAPPGGRRAPREGQPHLGDGPGTAAPGVQHDRILVSFLQHFILKSKTRSSGRNRPGATGFSSAPKTSLLSEICAPAASPSPGRLIRNAEPQAARCLADRIRICIQEHSQGMPPPRCNISLRSTGLRCSHQTPRAL